MDVVTALSTLLLHVHAVLEFVIHSRHKYFCEHSTHASPEELYYTKQTKSLPSVSLSSSETGRVKVYWVFGYSSQPYWISTVIISILEMRKWRQKTLSKSSNRQNRGSSLSPRAWVCSLWRELTETHTSLTQLQGCGKCLLCGNYFSHSAAVRWEVSEGLGCEKNALEVEYHLKT